MAIEDKIDALTKAINDLAAVTKAINDLVAVQREAFDFHKETRQELRDSIGRIVAANADTPEAEPETETPKPKTEKPKAAAKTEKPKAAAKTEEPEAEAPTAAEVRDAVFKVRDTIGKTEAVTLIKKVAGVEKLGEVKPAKYAALISACTDALDALGAEGEGPAEDDI